MTMDSSAENVSDVPAEALQKRSGTSVFIAFWLLALMGIAAYLRMDSAIDAYHFNPDEMFFYYVAKGRSLADVFRFSLGDAHPPLFMALLHFWLQMDDNAVFARFLNVILNVLLVPIMYFTGKQIQGRFAGIVCATLATFSYGFIAQSNLLRNYSCQLFFLSLCFYWLLRWHASHGMGALAAYCVLGFFACMSHFTSINAVFCFGLVEGLFLLPRLQADKKPLMRWMAGNVLLACAVMPIYYQWEPVQHALLQERGMMVPDMMQRIYYAPLDAFMYLLPMPLNAFAPRMAAFIVAYFLIKEAANKKSLFPVGSPNLLFPFAVLALGSILLILLYITNVIPTLAMDTRHHLWLAPVFISVVGAKLALYAGPDGKASAHALTSRQILIAFCAIAVGFFFYNPYVIRGNGEYMMTENTYQALERYLKSLDSHHLILADRNIGFIIAPNGYNPYADFDHWGWADKKLARLIPLANTRMLLDATDMRLWDGHTLANLYRHAKEDGQTGNAEQLVFIKNGFWSADGVNKLIECDALKDKTIETIAPEDNNSVMVLTIPAETFEEAVLNPTGKAHRCLL